MLAFLKKIFGVGKVRRRGVSGAAAEADLARVEVEIRGAGRGGEAARLYNRAGDLYLVKGDRAAALNRYGRAIDNYLHSGEYDNAMAVCRKIIRVVPEVIRTRRTLAWLCIGKGFLEIAREHVEVYVQASRDAELHSMAVQQVMLMSQYVDQVEFRHFLAEKLEELGDPEAGRRVREGMASEAVRNAGWTAVVFGAMLTPDEMRLASRQGVEIRAPIGEAGSDDFERLLFDPEAAKKPTAEGGRGEGEPVD